MQECVPLELWEILVPTEKPSHMKGKNRYFTTKYHKRWDEKVIKIAGGLTVFQPSKGAWVSPCGKLFAERMIPVKIACNKDQLAQIIWTTAKHYEQEAVMAYKVSDTVLITHFRNIG